MQETWRTASYSMNNGACAEIGAWRTSLFSEQINCIEAGSGQSVIGVRDTKEAHLGDARTVLAFAPAAWSRFISGLK